MNITILGAGAFGLSLSINFNQNKNNNITIWSKFESEINNLKNKFPEFKFTSNLSEALTNTNIIIIAIPIEFTNDTITEVKKYYQKGIILIASKGIETKNQMFAYQLLTNIFPDTPYGILSGGTFAKDMMNNNLMGITLATTSKTVKNITKKALADSQLKLEITNDIIGTSICGAAKNIMAIGFGIMDGLNYPDSTKFLFLTEAILEIKTLIYKLKGNKKTILTYAGIDDIMMTCTSSTSRNYTLGKMIGQNIPTEEYIKTTTVEGLKTSQAFYKLLKAKEINAPLINTIYQILYHNKNPKEIINILKKIPK